jgi:hypothetical protein
MITASLLFFFGLLASDRRAAVLSVWVSELAAPQPEQNLPVSSAPQFEQYILNICRERLLIVHSR